MASGSEKYQADRGNNQEESSEAGKKTAKVAAKAAADYFTGGKGGAIVDKVADTKIGNQVLDKAGKVIDKTPGLNKAAQKLNDSGALDAADKGLSMMESGGAASGSAAGGTIEGNTSGKTPSSSTDSILDSTGKNSKKKSLLEDSSSENSSDKEKTALEGIGPFNLMDIAKGNIGIKMSIISLSFFLFIIMMFIAIISSSDENGTDPAELHGNNSDSCITDNLQADELCRLHDEGKYEEWINLFGPVAQKDYSRSGVFASITTAQVMIESGWACSHIQNNLFGIKCHGYSSCIATNTREEYNGQSVSIIDSFRTYPSVANSIEDHSNFLKQNSIYSNAGVFSAKDYKEQAYALKKAGYATDSNYANKLINQIESYNLDRFDVTVNTSSFANCGGDDISSASGWNIRTTKPLPSDNAFNYKSNNRGQCVWYAQARAIEIVEDLQNKGKLTEEMANNIKNRLLNTYGNGGDWYENTRGNFKGSSNVNDIKAGSLISWKKPGGYGHVAVIEEVTDDKVTITEGWATNGSSCPTSWDCVNFLKRTVSREEFNNSFGKYYTGSYQFSGYIYFLELEG